MRFPRVQRAEFGELGPLNVRLIGWSSTDNRTRAAELGRSQKLLVRVLKPRGLGFLTRLARWPPEVLVIDLDRLPSPGKDIGLAVRARRSTRQIPLVFAGGTPNQMGLIRRLLPDARFAPWNQLLSTMRQGCPTHQKNPVAPLSLFDRYSTVPLLRNLGVKPGTAVDLLAAPRGFASTLGDLPPGAELRNLAT